jgi:hypothetical protein
MGIWKATVTMRIRQELRDEMIQFAEREQRSLGNLGAILLEWSFGLLKATGSTDELLGRRKKQLNEMTRDRRWKDG